MAKRKGPQAQHSLEQTNIDPTMTIPSSSQETKEFDYIVVGSGAGGGPLAARLARAGYRVLVIEAGADESKQPATAPAREVSQVPALHGPSTEHPDLSWQFFAKHYDNPPSGQDPKWDADEKGIFYPRAASLGGCTVHNAMITVCGPDSDWDDLADFIDDDSWSSEVMRSYFQRLERNEYLPRPEPPPTSRVGRFKDNVKWLFGFDPDYTGGRHGFDGWLRTSWADVSLGIHDGQLVKMLKGAVAQVKLSGLERFSAIADNFLHGRGKPSLDPNHAGRQAKNPAGLALIPLAVCGKDNPLDPNASPEKPQRGRRNGPREFLLETQALHPDRLEIWTEHLVTKVIFETAKTNGAQPKAIGVEYLKGRHLYRAHPQPSSESGVPGSVRAKREVILCGGAFNTPQLLMLSGIGDREQLASKGIKCLADLPGVGKNLHDRYEVTVLSEMDGDFSVLDGATFGLPDDPNNPDAVLKSWREQGTGLYTSNGAIIGILKRSRPDVTQPDLFIFGIPLPFEGYQRGYSDVRKKYPNDYRRLFTWAILKSQTKNRDGTVKLRSSNPLDTPDINFHYFHETSRPGESSTDPDLLAVLDGVKFVRGIAKNAKLVVKGEYKPDGEPIPEDDEGIKDWIRRVAWGHHACGTCRMGPEGDADAVLDSRFRVRNVTGLRIVDASIFPKIPGYFIVTNIYIASEKAADVIIEDARHGGRDSVLYPRELREMEAAALIARRSKIRSVPAAAGKEVLDEVPQTGPWPDDTTGLALSGGGVRSATLNLGILQALAKQHLLRRVDFLSTVSGGGYVGSFLGRFFDNLRSTPLSDTGRKGSQPAADRVERELVAADSREISWLRKHANFIAPSGKGDGQFNLAVFLRNLLSLHFVVGALLFAMFGVANAVRYGILDKVDAGLRVAWSMPSVSDFPVGHLLQSAFGIFWSPWFILFELLLLILVIPRICGYWIASQDDNERYHWPPLAVMFVLVAALFYVGIRDGFTPQPLLLALSLLASLIHVEIAWQRGRVREEAVGSGGDEVQRFRTRAYLTYDLGLALAIAGAAFGFAVIDTIGHGLQQWLIENRMSYAEVFGRFGVILVAAFPALRMIANFLAKHKSDGPETGAARKVRGTVIAALLAVLLFAIPLIFFSFASHAVYQGGTALVAGIGATLLGLVISGILANPAALAFVNRSSLATTYAARLASAFLGASNSLRHQPQGADVTDVMPGDDVASIRDYKPHEAGGPLHLINVTLNQTVDFSSQRGNRDRKGENFAVSSIGLSIDRRWHSFWTNREGAQPADPQCEQRASIIPLACPPNSELPVGAGIEQPPGRKYNAGFTGGHPLLDESGRPTNSAETLSLRQWVGISGAAISPGRGQNTSLGFSLLFGLANLRTGYWWDSGIADSARDGFPKLTFLRRFLYLLPRIFVTQSLLLFELVARYPGPWERFWYLSDGGFFENLAAYELIRRRVPRIIIGDAGADPSYQFDDFANLVRKVRLDFNAFIEPFTEADLAAIPTDVVSRLGTLKELQPRRDEAGNLTPSAKHASLFWIRYPDDPTRKSVLLYIKASLTGNESADIENYQINHPEFPHESTADQFFDEEQWESYRALGQHMAGELFEDPSWFWSIPVSGVVPQAKPTQAVPVLMTELGSAPVGATSTELQYALGARKGDDLDQAVKTSDN
ncbi:GMC oxidoreductase [Verrucomicrobiota bacterium sgz303538]